jgi:hypothetical protein
VNVVRACQGSAVKMEAESRHGAAG